MEKHKHNCYRTFYNILRYTTMIRFLQWIFVLFLLSRSYDAAYSPAARMLHSASLINSKLYVAGGSGGPSYLNDTFYLDLSSNFILDKPSFVNDGTTPNLIISLGQMGYAIGGKDNATIFLFAGFEGVITVR